jgi:transcriptional regulator with XRE-family HTH domain
MVPKESPSTALGTAIRKLRHDRGLTQEALAHRSGITVGHLSKIERGVANPSWETVVAIADGLGLPPAQLARSAES